jgi:chromosome segregation ATPase
LGSVDQLLKRNEHLEKQLEKEQAKNQSFKEQQYQLSKLIEELEAARKQKNDQIAQLRAEAQVLKQEQASQAGLVAQVKELDAAKQKVDALERKMEEKEQELFRQRVEYDQLKKEKEAHLSAAQRLEFAVKNAELDNEDLLAKLDG